MLNMTSAMNTVERFTSKKTRDELEKGVNDVLKSASFDPLWRWHTSDFLCSGVEIVVQVHEVNKGALGSIVTIVKVVLMCGVCSIAGYVSYATCNNTLCNMLPRSAKVQMGRTSCVHSGHTGSSSCRIRVWSDSCCP
jgi:hypothetical protein